MARRRGSYRRFRPRKRIVWDTIDVVQADLPTIVMDNAGLGTDGAFTSIKRYDGTDLVVERTIFDFTCRIEQEDFQVSPDAVLELCVGLSWFDSMSDISGIALNSTLVDGTGPLSDADNSRWYARCCVQIPIGQFVSVTANASMVVPLTATARGPHSGHWWHKGGGTALGQEISWYCTWDSKAKRKQQGIETENLQLCMEGRVTPIPAVGDSVDVSMNHFGGRHVLSLT